MRCIEVHEADAPLRDTTRPTPVPKGVEVLVKVTACGVCHTDIHLWHGYYDLGEGGRIALKDRGIAPPFVMGHEVVGEIVAIGPDVKDVKIGETRLVYPWIGCGECDLCKSGEETYCAKPRFVGIFIPGGYADHCLVPHSKYLIDISGFDPSDAAPYGCSGLTAYGALKKIGRAGAGDYIAVIGAGGVGLNAIRFGRVMYPEASIVAVDVDAHKLDVAKQMGAQHLLDASKPEATKELVKLTNGRLKVAIDFVGSPATAAMGFASIRKGGTVISVGLFGGSFPISLPLLPMRELTVRGSYVGSLEEMHELMDLLRKKKIAPIPVEKRPLSAAYTTLTDLEQGKITGRVVLVPSL